MKKITHPLTIFLIGATGDLAKKKILKAIYNLHIDALLPETFTLVGNARTKMSHDEFRMYVKEIVKPENPKQWNEFMSGLYYVSGDASKRSTYEAIKSLHTELEAYHHCGNHMWYVATLPSLYLDIVQQLKKLHLHKTQCGWTKILMEKPFGTDLDSAQLLNKELTEGFDEEQIFRIDHFLGKETVQNLLAFRFANGLFEHLWNAKYIDHIQVNATETFGVEGREKFYDETGTVRDVVQNHVLQMIAVSMMEEPESFSSSDIRKRRSEFLGSLKCPEKADCERAIAFGQFDGYAEQVGKKTSTETAVAVKFTIDNDRWRGVPIYVRAGKKLARDLTEISIQFKEPENTMFKEFNLGKDPNILTLRIQPNEGIILRLFVKKPGHGMELDEVPMEFCYRNQYQMGFVEAYERLIHDASQGDSTLFPRADEIEHSWEIIDKIMAHKQSITPGIYKPGSWGPESFQKLLTRDEKKWIEPSIDVCGIGR